MARSANGRSETARPGGEARSRQSPRREAGSEHGLLAAIAAVPLAMAIAVIVMTRGGGAVLDAEAEPPSPVAVQVPTLESLAELDRDTASAITAAVAAAQHHPSATTLGELGLLYRAHGLGEHARRALLQAAALDPSEPEWVYHLGLLATEEGRPQEAYSHFRRTLALRPDYLPAYRHLGDTLIELGQLVEAETAFQELVARAPDAPWGHLGLAEVALALGEPGAAEKLLQPWSSDAAEPMPDPYLDHLLAQR